ncbi:MAG: hypothetical protein WCT18_00835 [Patescibacteria group bacterium]
MTFENGFITVKPIDKKLEKKGKNRERLLRMQESGKYVFHGSPIELPKLSPLQAYRRNKETGEMEKDGEPAVFATQFADIAIFRSLINQKDVIGPTSSSFGVDDNGFYSSATANLYEAAKKKIGKIYVFEKSKFGDIVGMECRSTEEVEPLEVIDVYFDDLPTGVKMIENQKK